ncbi:uncharacterized protein BDZ99DRAFT_469048 [Mytilinidion resinicola]|uniref:RING-type domain-containing protein n=1 Tax=Mytilinidion resinicola TaxID=574789 RepID=A0A6A6Y0J9_9PEZI|nr:uncharacterized protein BDZ99DRAFT_469048 [Mytilinidion resinicola]KAF2802292.1 hypothetical protein BDZ99DRAFT_469048 [Mytilinidion resinicola]
MYYSITEAAARPMSSDFIKRERVEQYRYENEQAANGQSCHAAERLEHDMDRVSKYEGSTTLGLVTGYFQFFISRTTDINLADGGLIPVRESEDYSMTLGKWTELGARLKRQAERQQQPLKVWWERLETLRLAKTDRAYHSVQLAMEKIGRLDSYNGMKKWKTPPIDSRLTDVWRDELGDSDEDKRCLICFDDFTYKGSDRAVRLECNHCFGRECIKKWVESSSPPKPCPACRKAIRPPPPRTITPPPVFGPFDRPVTINCAILVDWYNEFKAKEEASTYSERRFNPITCSEVTVMEQVFNTVLPPAEGVTCSPYHFSITLQQAVSGRLRELLSLFSTFPALRDRITPGFEKLCGRICDGMAVRLQEQATKESNYYEDEGL